MRDLARAGCGGEILSATCVDANHPPEDALDGLEGTFWVTTGMYPQEFVLAVGGTARVSKITTLCRDVRRLMVESSAENLPEGFTKLFEVDLSPRPRQLQTEAQTVNVECRYLRWTIVSGYEEFACVNRISVLGELESSVTSGLPANVPSLNNGLAPEATSQSASLGDEQGSDIDDSF